MGFEPATSGTIVDPVMDLPLSHRHAFETLRFNNHYHLLKSDKNEVTPAATRDGGVIYDTITGFLLNRRNPVPGLTAELVLYLTGNCCLTAI